MADDRIHGGDPCPRCGIKLDWDEQEIILGAHGFPDEVPFIIHPEPQCGWRPDGYPSTREGWGEPPKAERDEVLMAEVRDQYRDLGLDEDSIAEAISAARDAGMFDAPDWR